MAATRQVILLYRSSQRKRRRTGSRRIMMADDGHGQKQIESIPPIGPNILVTGTPGVGKTTLCTAVCAQLGLRHVDVGAFARERGLLGEYDGRLHCHYLDEDGVLDALEPMMSDGGVLLDHHSVDWFPERWVHLVIVLRASTHVLHDRLTARGYAPDKREENMQAEIMQVVLDEAQESYPRAQLIELMSDNIEQQQSNIREVVQAVGALRKPSSLRALIVK